MPDGSFAPRSHLPQPKTLAESSGNRQAMPPPTQTNGGAQKRGIQPPSMFSQPQTKVPRMGNIQGHSMLELNSHKNSTIGRPASAAGTRHAASRSIDPIGMKSRIGTGARPISRSQAAKPRPRTAMEGNITDKDDGASDVTMSSMDCSFLSRCSSSNVYTNQASESGHSVSTKSLITELSRLAIDSKPPEDKVTARNFGLRRTQSSSIMRPPKAFVPVLSPQKEKSLSNPSPKKSPVKTTVRTVTPFLTKESNNLVNIDFNVHEKLTSFEGYFNEIKSVMAQGGREQETLNAAMELYKTRVVELERLREKLEGNNMELQQDLSDVRASYSATLLQSDEMRREHLNELDSAKRASRDEIDEMRRRYNAELDDMRRKNQATSEQASLLAQDEIKQLERRHQSELDDIRREMNWSLDEEKRERKREVQALQDEAQAAQRNAETGSERHIRELEDKDERIAQLTRQVEREREIADDLRKQLVRSSEQNDELENTSRSLKARVEFLQSDNESQSQSFADLEQRTQDALKQTEEYKNQLRKEETMRRKLLNTIQDLKGNIRVFCRVRPPLPHEQGSCAGITFPDAQDDAKAIEVRGVEDISSLGKDNTKTHPFNFDRAFGPGSENSEIFTELSELVAAVCGGSFNTCIFSYGQTGSGKTYTMASADGMISRAVNQIFDTAASLIEKGWKYQVSGSFVEVYNENINDLLGRPEDFDKQKHEIRHDMQKMTTTITDVVETSLESADHFGAVLDQALKNRSIAATKANERSSRSHSVCILRIEGQNHVSGEKCSSTLNLVDLAGSERLAHSQATGAQLKETQNINKSLSCLKDVIAALGDPKENGHVPYRNSKLTYLLQNSLGGNSKTLMFVMISPLQEHLSETLSSLNFATKVNNTRIVKKKQK